MSVRLRAVALTAVLPLLLAGCSDDSSPRSSPSEPPGSSTGSSTSPSTSPSTEPSSSPSGTGDGVAPATGQQISLDHISLRVPADWGTGASLVQDGTAAFTSDDFVYALGFSENDQIQSGDLKDVARDFSEAAVYPTPQKVLDNVEIGGVTWFHIAGEISAGAFAEDYGTFAGGVLVTIGLESQPQATKQQRTAALDAIMASVVLTP